MKVIWRLSELSLSAWTGKVVLICLVCLSAGCLQEQAIVPFDHLYGYMEVAKSEHGETEFRTYAGADSFMPISDYALVRPTNDAKNIFLTLFWTTSGKSVCISEDDVTGLLVRIPDVSFNQDANYWYQDKQGRHSITKGTAQSWQKHLEEWRELSVDSDWKRKLQQTRNEVLRKRQGQSAGVTPTNAPTRTREDTR